MEFTCSASRPSRLLLVQVAAVFIASSAVPVALVSGSTTGTPSVSTAGKSTTAATTDMSTDVLTTAEPTDKNAGISTITTTLSSATSSEFSNETSSTSVAGPARSGVTTPITTSTSKTSSGISDFTNATTMASTSSDSSAVPASSSMAATSKKSLGTTTTPKSSSTTPNTTTATITTTSNLQPPTTTSNASQSTAGTETSSNTTTAGTDSSTQNYTAATSSTPSTPSSGTSQGTSTDTGTSTSAASLSTSTTTPPPSTFTTGRATTSPTQKLETTPASNGVIAAVVVIIVAIAIAVALFVVVWLRRHQRCQWKGTRVQKRRPAPRKRIKTKYFTSYVDLLHKDSGLLFQEQFEEIQLSTPKTYTYEAALKDENKIKNRYVNIIPYDHTRVKLSADTEAGGSDFINASYIPGYSSPREYIATQGPMTSTADDFWRMIWEQKSGVIVMLSDLQEKGRRKVDRYWPEEASSPEQFGDVGVELTSVSTHTCYTIRHFKLRMEKQEERMVLQFFIPGWEDHGANLSPDDIINFVQAVRMEARTREGPVTVHCSAGVGRTGTFIALDFLMQYVSDNDLEAEVDIYNLVLNMRHSRPSMVQSEKQYVFIHDVLKIIIERKINRLQGSNGVCERSSAVTNPAFDTVCTPDADELDGNSSQMLFTSSL